MKRTFATLALVALVFGVSLPAGAVANPKEAIKIREDARVQATERKVDKETRIASIKEEVAARKLLMQQEKCEARSERLQEKVPKLANSANVIKGVIDKKYDQVQEFYTSGKLTVDNYKELVKAIEFAKADAGASLEAVNTYEFEIDCENKKVGEQLDSFRTAVKETRDVLKQYRKTLVALISSLKSEAAESDSEVENETENESNTDSETETETETEVDPGTEVKNE
ncbi:MAG: hypothetical protein M3Q14_02315 [bacterium]|nr:hypothetical protein [bacterium]